MLLQVQTFGKLGSRRKLPFAKELRVGIAIVSHGPQRWPHAHLRDGLDDLRRPLYAVPGVTVRGIGGRSWGPAPASPHWLALGFITSVARGTFSQPPLNGLGNEAVAARSVEAREKRGKGQ